MWTDWVMSLLSVLGSLAFVTLNALIFAVVYMKVMGNGFNKMSFKDAKGAEKITFDDVLGVDEAKQEAREVVDFLRRADELKRIGARAPRGILLVGPPGTGKTLLAKAIAHEAGVPFFSLSGSDFNEVFVGVGAARVRKLYAEARKHKAAIVFIDEIDAAGRQRNNSPYGGGEHNNTLNALLVEMDGFGRGGCVITIGATNLDEHLDAALLRPGRFDRKIHVGLPGLEGRRAILEHYGKRIKAEPGVDWVSVARATPSMSGADLAMVVNEGSILAVRSGRKRVAQRDIFAAIERMGLGAVQGRTLSERERRTIAYHEAGHAVVGHVTSTAKKLQKISILPTGKSALGYTWSVHTEDRHLATREELLGEIAALYGGRLAEALVFGPAAVSSGASDDLKRATAIAELMVLDLGYAPGFPGAYRDTQVSEATRRALDAAVGLMLKEGQALAQRVLHAHRRELERLARMLLQHEVLDGAQVERALRGGGTVSDVVQELEHGADAA